MKSFQSLIVALLAIIVISTPVVAESSTQLRTQQQPQLESQDERKLFFGLGKSIGRRRGHDDNECRIENHTHIQFRISIIYNRSFAPTPTP